MEVNNERGKSCWRECARVAEFEWVGGSGWLRWMERERVHGEGRRGTSKGRGTDRRDTRRYGLYRWLKGAGAEGRKSQIGERVPRARWSAGRWAARDTGHTLGSAHHSPR